VAAHNGGGDLYYTDGEVWVCAWSSLQEARRSGGDNSSPPAVELKDQIWAAVAGALGK